MIEQGNYDLIFEPKLNHPPPKSIYVGRDKISYKVTKKRKGHGFFGFLNGKVDR